MALLLPVVVGGCAGHENYTVARRQMDAGDRAAAVASLREAVRQDPGNIEYQMQLSDAENAAADQHVATAEQQLREGREDEARAELRIALGYMPGHPRATVLLRRLEHRAGGGETTVAAAASQPVVEPPVQASAAEEPAVVSVTAQPPEVAKAAPPAASEAVQTPPAVEPARGPFRGTLSRGDSRYPSELDTRDGIRLRLRDTSREPLLADIEIRVGEAVRGYRGLRVGTRLAGRGVSGTRYRLEILSIDPRRQTISFRLEEIEE